MFNRCPLTRLITLVRGLISPLHMACIHGSQLCLSNTLIDPVLRDSLLVKAVGTHMLSY